MPASFGGRPLLDPHVLRMDCQDRGVPTDPWFGLANSYRHPLGERPGTGHLLMSRAEFTKLKLTDTAGLAAEFRDDSNRVLSVKKLTVLGATAVTPGAPNDPSAAVYLRVADRRHHLAKVPTDRAFNVRTADGGDYLSATLDGGSPWTWATLLARLWDDLRAAFGDLPAWPGLPFTPDGTPENFDFYGGQAWAALNLVLGRLACAVRYDPTLDPATGTWTVVRLGADDAAAVAAIAALGGVRDWDDEPADPARGWRPEKVRVLFRRRPLPTDGGSPWYYVDVTLAAAAGVVAGTYVTLVDDLAALGDTGTPSNAAACAARAAERAADWLRQRSGWGNPKLKQWEGVRPEVRSILGKTVAEWSVEDRGRGVDTAIAARPADFGLPFDDLTGSGAGHGVSVCGSPIAPALVTGDGCPPCGTLDVVTIRDVNGVYFEPCDFQVLATSQCGGGTGGTTGSGSSGGNQPHSARVLLTGKTETVDAPYRLVFCPDTCTIKVQYQYLCYRRGLYIGRWYGAAADCGSGSGAGSGLA